MIVATTRAELKAARDKLPGPVVLVPTMGALHDGHRALLRRAREIAGAAGTVAVSIFVNPLQFGPNEDLDRYPRTLAARTWTPARPSTLTSCSRPASARCTRGGSSSPSIPAPAGEILEGEFRPGFFHGVLTVVLKLFSLVRPDIAVFGQKDAQQLALVRQMVADFALGIEIEARADGARRGRARAVEQEQVPVFIGTYGGDCPAQGPCRGRRRPPRAVPARCSTLPGEVLAEEGPARCGRRCPPERRPGGLPGSGLRREATQPVLSD